MAISARSRTFLIKDGNVTRVFPSVKVDGHAENVLAALGGAPKPKKTVGHPPKAYPAKPAKTASTTAVTGQVESDLGLKGEGSSVNM